MSRQPATPLDDPDDYPGAIVVIWDGRCNFCRQQVQRLSRFDRSHRLAYLSLHDSRVAERYPDLSHEQLMQQLWIVLPEGAKLGGADAFRYLSRKLPRLWFAMPLLHLPFAMPAWRWVYSKVAQRRYAIAGMDCDEGGTCELHRIPGDQPPKATPLE